MACAICGGAPGQHHSTCTSAAHVCSLASQLQQLTSVLEEIHRVSNDRAADPRDVVDFVRIAVERAVKR